MHLPMAGCFFPELFSLPFVIRKWQKDTVFTLYFFPFYFPDQTVPLQRKSNLILNIFSMKAIGALIHSRKSEIQLGTQRESHHGNCFLEILNSPGSRHDCVKKEGELKRSNIMPFLLSLQTQLRDCHELLIACIEGDMN